MRMHHADRVGPRSVDRGMNDEAGGIDGPARLLPRLPVGVDLDQRARRDLLEKKPIRIDEKAMALARNSRRQMCVHEVRHPKERYQAISRGKVLSELVLSGRSVRRGGLWNGQCAMFHRLSDLVGFAWDRRARCVGEWPLLSRHVLFPPTRGVHIF